MKKTVEADSTRHLFTQSEEHSVTLDKIGLMTVAMLSSNPEHPIGLFAWWNDQLRDVNKPTRSRKPRPCQCLRIDKKQMGPVATSGTLASL